MTLGRALVRRFHAVLAELAKFGVVGTVSLLVDLAVFNLVLGAMPHKPLTAKVFSTVLAASTAFVLNRHWSFRRRSSTTSLGREMLLFAFLNGVGLLLALSCLFLSHYVLGLQGRLADNLAANGVGLVLGTAFRFWSYRRFLWVAVQPAPIPRAGPPRPEPAYGRIG